MSRDDTTTEALAASPGRKRTLMQKLDGVERRIADRAKDDSNLRVIGVAKDGRAFQELTRARDVSPGGISFPLRTSIEPGSLLDLSICSNDDLDPVLRFQMRARVLRVCRETSGNLFVIAARFEGDFAEAGGDRRLEKLVAELQRAVSRDEGPGRHSE